MSTYSQWNSICAVLFCLTGRTHQKECVYEYHVQSKRLFPPILVRHLHLAFPGKPGVPGPLGKAGCSAGRMETAEWHAIEAGWLPELNQLRSMADTLELKVEQRAVLDRIRRKTYDAEPIPPPDLPGY